MAYFLVHSLAVDSYLERSVLYTCAISGTKGSSGFGSVSMEQIDSRTFQKSVEAPKDGGLTIFLLTFRNSERRAPLVTEDVQADATVGIDVRVVDAGGEVDLGWFEGIVGRKMDS